MMPDNCGHVALYRVPHTGLDVRTGKAWTDLSACMPGSSVFLLPTETTIQFHCYPTEEMQFNLKAHQVISIVQLYFAKQKLPNTDTWTKIFSSTQHSSDPWQFKILNLPITLKAALRLSCLQVYTTLARSWIWLTNSEWSWQLCKLVNYIFTETIQMMFKSGCQKIHH